MPGKYLFEPSRLIHSDKHSIEYSTWMFRETKQGIQSMYEDRGLHCL